MKYNSELLELIKEKCLPMSDTLCYLTSIYFGLTPSFIPIEFKTKVQAMNVFTLDSKEQIQWNISLFEGAETHFDWVKDYCQLFKDKNSVKGGKIREATLRMKKMFSQFPDVRKQEVLEATKLYLRNTDRKYIMFPHYFIIKGNGADKTYTLMDWVDKYRELVAKKKAVNLSTKMQ